jgi:hypothetical protein
VRLSRSRRPDRYGGADGATMDGCHQSGYRLAERLALR